MATIARTVASGSTDTFSVPFAYIDKSHVEVYVNGVLLASSLYTWPNASSIKITSGNPSAGTIITRKRATPVAPLTVFVSGPLDVVDLNAANLQALYVSEEAADGAEDLTYSSWNTYAGGGTITKGTVGQLAEFDASGNVVPNAATVASILSAMASAVAQTGADRVQTGLDVTAANAALASALAAYDSFDDRYLGAKTSDPTLDNDGNALVAGSLYFNSLGGGMKIWNGSTWDAAYVAGGSYMLLAGGTFTGQVITVASGTGASGLRVPHGAAPTSPTNGDFWSTTAAFFARINGVTQTLLTLAGGTLTGLLVTVASATGGAGFRLPHGTAPTSPVNGDLWSTTAALFARLNGATRTILSDSDIGTTVQGYDAQLSSRLIQNSKSAAYTLVLTDGGKMISHPAADTTARIWTIPANASVAFPIGTPVTFDNEFGAGVITIAITSDTLELVGTVGSTGSRTLASGGQATAVKVSATKWRISGTGLT